MPTQFTRADALREYFTGATSDGGVQGNPQLCFGNFRSSTEATSLGLVIRTPLVNVSPLYAGGANLSGIGLLKAIDSSHLTWRCPGATQDGPPTAFLGTGDTQIVEALNAPGAYLRVLASGPFTPGQSSITLSYLADNVFAMDDVSVANALAGISEYRATMVRNEAASAVIGFQRWIATLGTQRVSDNTQLAGTGAGTIGSSAVSAFQDWPTTGWCRIESLTGTLKEIVYYTAKTTNTLTIPAVGRARLGTTSTAGVNTDKIYPVPGIAIAIDPLGVQAFGTNIQTIISSTTGPIGVTWNLGILPSTGLQIGNMSVNTQVGIWIWREIPPGAVSTPQALTMVQDSFAAF